VKILEDLQKIHLGSMKFMIVVLVMVMMMLMMMMMMMVEGDECVSA